MFKPVQTLFWAIKQPWFVVTVLHMRTLINHFIKNTGLAHSCNYTISQARGSSTVHEIMQIQVKSFRVCSHQRSEWGGNVICGWLVYRMQTVTGLFTWWYIEQRNCPVSSVKTVLKLLANFLSTLTSLAIHLWPLDGLVVTPNSDFV